MTEKPVSPSRSQSISPTLVARLRAEAKEATKEMADIPGVIAGGIRYLAALCAEAADAIEANPPSEIPVGAWREDFHADLRRQCAWIDDQARYVGVIVEGKRYTLELPKMPEAK